MELKELKKKKVGELEKLLAEFREKLRDLRFKDANKQLKDVREIRKTRNIIAQILTLINQKRNEQKNNIIQKEGEESKTNKKDKGEKK
jgi:large subunit ribosomal protein L29